MKNISKEELQARIRDLINRKITREGLAADLKTDLRTLHKEITGVSKTNPELYKEYIEAFPYQPRVREDIDYEALIIDVMKRNKKFTECI